MTISIGLEWLPTIVRLSKAYGSITVFIQYFMYSVIQMREAEEVIVSYLPLSHIAGNMVDIWAVMFSKGTTYFADKSALKGTLVQTLQEARPTIFLACRESGKKSWRVCSVKVKMSKA